MRPRHYHVYILTNNAATVFYVGVTNDLRRRMNEHRQGLPNGFTKRYSVRRLVYFETHPASAPQSIAKNNSNAGNAPGRST